MLKLRHEVDASANRFQTAVHGGPPKVRKPLPPNPNAPKTANGPPPPEAVQAKTAS
jgi:hypothetical protein